MSECIYNVLSFISRGAVSTPQSNNINIQLQVNFLLKLKEISPFCTGFN